MTASTKKLTTVAMLLALSYLGSLIKIPTPVGSTAFDSASAYFSGLLLGGPCGALVGCVAHLFTAFVSGFPLSLPVHLLVAAGMGGSVLVFSLLWRYSKPLAVAAALLANGILLPLCLLLWPVYTLQIIMAAMIPYLLLATALNLLVAVGLWTAWGARRAAS